MNSQPPDPSQVELDDALALIKYEIQYADTHGDCPPAIKGIKRHGLAKAKAKLTAWAERSAKRREQEARVDELKKLWNATQPGLVPSGWEPETPEGKYMRGRIAELTSLEMKG